MGVFRSLPGKRTNRLRRCRQGFYSPECVEGKFSEVGSPPREPRSIILIFLVAEGCTECEHP